MTFRLRRRGSLIAATVLLQAVVIGLGWLALMHVSRSGLESRVHERMLEEGARVATEVSTSLTRGLQGPAKAGTEDWTRAQRIVMDANRGGRLSVFLLDLQGRVVCHPAMSNNPAITRMDYSEQPVRLHPDGEVVELGQLRSARPIVGDAEFVSGPAAVAVAYNEAAQAKIVVVQPGGLTAGAAAEVSGALMRWWAVGGATILLLTILGSAALVRRYDSVLERANERLEHELERRVRRGLAIRNGLIFGLAKLADYRDTDTGRHLERICRYSELLARAMRADHPEITEAWIEQLMLASSMHDIGKVGIADSILLKPGRLTEDERRVMESHAVIGADTLIAIRQRVGDDELLNMGIQVALSHHERWDGTGYPYGLSGEQIPLAARIVALADIYDAMTSRRVYKQAMGHGEAVRAIRAARGTHLDPGVVAAFERVVDRFEAVRAELQGQADERPPLVDAVEKARAARGREAA